MLHKTIIFHANCTMFLQFPAIPCKLRTMRHQSHKNLTLNELNLLFTKENPCPNLWGIVWSVLLPPLFLKLFLLFLKPFEIKLNFIG